jgi:hypothetical protein
MPIRDYIKLKKYYIDIYVGSGNFTEKQADERVKSFIDSGSWAPEILGQRFNHSIG